MEATIELVPDQAALARIREADLAIARREGTTAGEMAELMKQRKARGRAA
jgi:hypothetical protein